MPALPFGVTLVDVALPLAFLDLVTCMVHHADLDALTISIRKEALRNIDQANSQQLHLARLGHNQPNIDNYLVVINIPVLRWNRHSLAVTATFVAV